MYGERYGVKTLFPNSDIRIRERIEWFFNKETAFEYAKSRNGSKVVKGVLHNDEGCSSWIETGEVVEDEA